MHRTSKISVLVASLAAISLFFSGLALADNLQNEVSTSSGSAVTVVSGANTSINYWVHATGGSCDVSDGNKAQISLSLPAGLSADQTSLQFGVCGSASTGFQTVVFSSTTPGSHSVTHTQTGGADINESAASFNMHVRPRPATALNAVGGNARIDLAWNASPDDTGANIDGYRVYRVGTTSPIASVGAGTTSYAVTGLTNGVQTCYTVSAYKGSLLSDATSQACATPAALPSVPGVPQLSGATSPNQGAFSLTWTASTNATSYTLERKTGTDPYAVVSSSLTTNGYTYTSAVPAPEGSSVYRVRANNASGSSAFSADSSAIVVDRTAPNTNISSGRTGSGQSRSASFEYNSTESGSTFECRITGDSDWTSCPAAGKSYSGLADGTYTFQVRARDAAGNADQSAATNQFTVDNVAPAAPVISSPVDNSWNNTGSFTVSGTAEADSTVELFEGTTSLGTATADSSGAWSKALSSVADGDHTYTAKATDAANNTSPASAGRTVRVDTQAPVAPVISSPVDNSWNNTGSFTVSGTAEADSTVELFEGTTSLGTATVGGDGAWSKSLSSVADGDHTYTAKATDAANNTSPASAGRTVRVDTQAPVAPVISSPVDNSWNNTGSFTVSGTAEADSTVELFEGTTSLGTATADSSGAWSKALSSVADGDHTYTAKATDAANNTSPASAGRTVRVDTQAPETWFTSAPTATTSSPNFGFGSDETGATYECKLDAAAEFTACPANGQFSNLDGGQHTLQVRARDAAGNVDPTPASHTWFVRACGFDAVMQPLNANGSSTYKQGSSGVVPVKFQLRCNDLGLIDTAAERDEIGTIRLLKGAFASVEEATSPVQENTISGNANTDNLFRFDDAGDLYIYNLPIKDLQAGTHTYTIAGGGAMRSFAFIIK